VPALARLDACCFGPLAWPLRAWRAVVLDPAWTTLVCGGAAAPEAALVLLAWPPEATLASIAVAPVRRRRGLGTALLREAVARARGAGARWLTLEVDADNAAGIRLYRREGFGLVRRFSEQGRARLAMARRLGGRHGG